MEPPATVGELTEVCGNGGYLADRGLATALFVLRSPCNARSCWRARSGSARPRSQRCSLTIFGRSLIRLQCYEGIDTNQALYEWDYARQMLHIRALSERQAADERPVDQLFGPRFLLERPLARSGPCGRPSRAAD